RVGEKLVLGRRGPVLEPRGVLIVRAMHFLQEYEVGGECAQPLAQLVYHQPPVEEGHALVDVVGRDLQGLHRVTGRWSLIAQRKVALQEVRVVEMPSADEG